MNALLPFKNRRMRVLVPVCVVRSTLKRTVLKTGNVCDTGEHVYLIAHYYILLKNTLCAPNIRIGWTVPNEARGKFRQLASGAVSRTSESCGVKLGECPNILHIFTISVMYRCWSVDVVLLSSSSFSLAVSRVAASAQGFTLPMGNYCSLLRFVEHLFSTSLLFRLNLN